MFKRILIALSALVVVLAVIVAMQPAEFHVTRSTLISAKPEKVFNHINNLHLWDAWSPWAKLDPNAVSAFEGPEEGNGAIMRWSGNSDVGSGSMEITESTPPRHIVFNLEFIEPMAGTSMSEFTLEPEGKQTKVTWTMSGHNNFIAKAMSLIFDCETIVGEQFEKGLANLKTVVESPQ